MIATLPLWLELVIGVCVAITAVAAAAKVIADLWTRSVQDAVRPLLEEMKPNGGASMRDAVDRIERSQRQLAERLDLHIKENREA